MKQLLIFLYLMSLALSNVSWAFDELDRGQYRVIDQEGRPGAMVFRLREENEQWYVDAQTAQGDWQSVACTKNCALTVSTPKQTARFLGRAIVENFHVSCLHNTSIAFCRLQAQDSSPRLYAMVILTENQPSIVELQPNKILN